MLARIFLFALMALGLCGFGTVAWISSRPPSPPPAQARAAHAASAPQVVTVAILAAAHPLRAGSFVRPEDLSSITVRAADMPAGGRRDTPGNRGALVGALIRHGIGQGEAFGDNVLLPAEHGFLATMLDPGMRAVTLGADQILSDTSLVWPGDHVDLILTQMDEHGGSVARRLSAETVLSDIRVIAIDQQLVQGETPEQKLGHGMRTVTVELLPDQAARLAVALRLGKLALSVRAAAHDPSDARSPGTVWAGDVAPSLKDAAEGRGAFATVHVLDGSGSDKEFRF